MRTPVSFGGAMFRMRILFNPILYSLLAFELFFAGLGAVGFIGPDEPRYAEVARGMLRSGDYVTPRLFGSPWFEKPPLYYWLAAAFFGFGANEFAARLPSAIAACGFLGLWFWFARRRFGGRTATLASILLAGSLGWIGFARAAAMDMLLAASLGAALLSLALWFWETEARYLYLFYGWLGVATLAKGPLAVAIAGIVGLAYLATFGEWRALKKLLISPALVVFLALAVPWYWVCYQRNGYAFIEEFFIRHNWQRLISGPAIGHPQPFWFYVPILVAGIFPWTPLIVLPVVDIIQRGLRNILQDRQRAFLIYWVILPFLFFSLSRNKLPGYLLPILPPLTLWIAMIVEGAVGQGLPPETPVRTGQIAGPAWPQRISLLLVGLSALLLLSLPFLCLLLPESLATGLRQALAGWNEGLPWAQVWKGPVPLPIWMALAGVVVLSLFLLWRKQVLEAALVALLGVGLGTLAVAHYLSPSINRVASMRTIAQRIHSLGIRGEDLAVFYIHRNQTFGLSFYLAHPLPEWSPEGHSATVSFVLARPDIRLEEILPDARPVALYPGPRLRVWMLSSTEPAKSGNPLTY